MKSYQAKTDQALKIAKGEQYKKAVSAFKKYYLGLMERGRLRYSDPLSQLLEFFNPQFICRLARTPVVVDGKLDDAAWKAAAAVTISNNVTGKTTQYLTTIKTCYDSQHVYFAISAPDPAPKDRSVQGGDPGTADGMEIYLDVPHNHRGYYRVGIDLTGKIYDRRSGGAGDPADAEWQSKAVAAVELGGSNYVMEVAIPRETLAAPTGSLADTEWGALAARTESRAAGTNDQKSASSPLLRGNFNQPNYFNNLRFTDR
jgi:hypothetical protein